MRRQIQKRFLFFCRTGFHPSCREKKIMEQFHFPAHIVNARRNGHHHMIVRGDHAQLTEHTIAAVTVLPGAPELIPVPLMPFVFGLELSICFAVASLSHSAGST